MKTTTAVTLAAIAALAAGCGSRGDLAPSASATSTYEAPTSTNAAYFVGGLQAVQEGASGFYYQETLADYLPNRLFSIEGTKAKSMTGGVVVGTVTKVEPGKGFVVVNVEPEGAVPDAPGGTAASFDDPDAAWRVAKVTIKTDATYGVDGEPDELQIGVRLISESDYQREMAGIEELGDVVVVLDPERTYDWDRDLKVVARGSALLGDIDTAGQIGFPGLGDGSKAFVGNLTTVAALEKAAAEPKRTIKARLEGFEVIRSD